MIDRTDHDDANPDKAGAFVRKPVELPKLFEEEPSKNGFPAGTKTAELV